MHHDRRIYVPAVGSTRRKLEHTEKFNHHRGAENTKVNSRFLIVLLLVVDSDRHVCKARAFKQVVFFKQSKLARHDDWRTVVERHKANTQWACAAARVVFWMSLPSFLPGICSRGSSVAFAMLDFGCGLKDASGERDPITSSWIKPRKNSTRMFLGAVALYALRSCGGDFPA